MGAVTGKNAEDYPEADPVIAEAAIAETSVAEVAEHHRPATEEDLYLYRREYFERDARARRADRQLGFLFLLTIVLFLVLAFRVESNDSKLATGLHTACLARVATANQYNIGREALVQQAIAAPTSPADPQAKAIMAQQLREALLLPIEDCGPPPGE